MDELHPARWAAEVLVYFEKLTKDLTPLLWRPYGVSYVVKDGDLSRAQSELFERFLFPGCEEIARKMEDTTLCVWRTQAASQGVKRVQIYGDNWRVEVSMGYDPPTSGVRIVQKVERLS
jgi:hypothetical protein